MTDQTKNNPRRDEALRLLHEGYPTIPVESDKNSPRYKGAYESWIEFQPIRKDGTPGRLPSQDEVLEMWGRHPNANLARIGGWEGVVVIDIDDPELAKLLKERFINHAPLFGTPRDGLHILARESEVSKSGPLIDGVVDIKGNGGYFVTWPSKGYKKLNDITEPLAIPTSARDYATDILAGLGYNVEPKQTFQKRNSSSGAGLKIPYHSRNNTLTSIAGKLRYIGLSKEEMRPALAVINERRCVGEDGITPDPVPDQEITNITKSIGGYPTESKGFKEALYGNEWQPLIAFEEYALPPFPTHILPAGLKECVEAVAHSMQVPTDLPAFSVLSTIATAAQRKIEITVRDQWSEPLNIFSAVILESGVRKSAVHELLTGRPLHEYERVQIELRGQDIAVEQAELRIKQKRLEKLEAALAKPGKLENMAMIEGEARDLARELAGQKPPVLPRLTTSDTTTEALASLMENQEEKMTVDSTEADIFSIMGGRYNRGVPNFDLYLKAYSGDSLRVDRKSGPPIMLDHPALTMSLTFQPSVLNDLGQVPQFTGKGLIARFIWAVPPSPLGYRQTHTAAVPEKILERFYTIVVELLSVQPQKENNKIIPYRLHLSPAAYEAFDAYHKLIESRMRPQGDLARIKNAAAKLMGNVARIAGLLHLVDHYQTPTPWAGEVSVDVIHRAIEVGEYLIPHIQAIHGMMKADPLVEDAKYLLRHLRRLGKASFTKNEILQITKARFNRVDALEPVLDLLVKHCYVRQQQTTPEARVGRPTSPTYEVNPAFISDGGQYEESNPLEHHIPSGPVTDFEDKKNVDVTAESTEDVAPAQTPQPDPIQKLVGVG